jgi:class 3 adenylate cyclase/tetratricopeptide (TPR) repeat protein
VICPGCGEIVRPPAKFCWECGAALARTATPLPPLSGRRQVTAMFCDLVNSMGMAERMDAEDLRDILASYQQTCTAIIERAHGKVARVFGDGILAVFGFPVAREDDARRAVAGALEICRRVTDLSRDVECRHGMALSVRIGIHTGMVVVDETAPGPPSQQNGLFGNALNIGARLQELAPCNGVVISQETFRLVQGHFFVENLGCPTLKGVSRPLQVYRVVESSAVRSIFEARLARGLSPLVGRETELAALEAEWAQAASGIPRSVLLIGDAGIGKSRLIYEFQRRHAQDECVRIIFQCAAQYRDTAFHPIVVELSRIFCLEPIDSRDVRLRKITEGLQRDGIAVPEMAADIAMILADDAGDVAANQKSGAQATERTGADARRRVIAALTSYLAATANRVPALLIFEDLHWADPSTIEFIRHLSQTLANVPVLLVSSVRRGTEAAVACQRTIFLDRIPAADCKALIKAVAGNGNMPSTVVTELIERSDGVPLFVEELTRSVTEAITAGCLEGDEAAESLDSIVPASLNDSITARLDRLGAAKDVAQVGALIGRSVPIRLLAAVWDGPPADLPTEIARLVDAEILFEHEQGAGGQAHGTLEFKHELVRNVASESILRGKRRTIHARIAATLARDFADECARHPEALAYHYTQAGDIDHALPLWELAGHRAVRVSANQEAVSHFKRALRLLDGFADAATRRAKELDLRINLVSPLMASKGYSAPEVDDSIARAMALARDAGDASRVFPLMCGRWSFDQVTGNLLGSHKLALQCLELAERSVDPAPRVIAYRLVGTSLQTIGRPREAAGYLARAIALFDDDRHTPLMYLYGTDIKVVSQCSLAMANWTLGLNRSANAAIEAAWERSVAVGHANTMGHCGLYRLVLRALSRSAEGYEEIASAQHALLAKHHLPLWSWVAPSYAGWLQLRCGDREAAARLFRQSIAAMEQVNLVYWQPQIWMWLGEALGELDRFDEAEKAFVCANNVMDRSGESWAEAELFRLWALVRRRSGVAGADALYARAVSVADRQGAVAFAVRTAADRAADDPAVAARLRDLLERHPAEEWSPEFNAAARLIRATVPVESASI